MAHSLLWKAKKFQETRQRSRYKSDRLPVLSEEQALYRAWLKGEIGLREVEHVTGRHGHNVYSRAWVVLRHMWLKGKLRFEV